MALTSVGRDRLCARWRRLWPVFGLRYF